MGNDKKIKKRIISYILLFLALLLGYFLLQGIECKSDSFLHTIIEIITSFAALFVGILALVHYYNRKSLVTLIIGSGFIGASILDMYQALITSPFCNYLFPSKTSAVISWSYFSSSLLLSLSFFMSLLAAGREKKIKKVDLPQGRIIYALIIVFIALSVELVSLANLPPGYYSWLVFSKAEELIPAFFFFITLIGYLLQGNWRTGNFNNWLILALISSFMGHFMYLAFSKHPFDVMFTMAHFLKILSYVFILIGLFISVYAIFKQEKYNEERISSILNSIADCVITTDKNGIIESCNPAIQNLFGYNPSEIIGKNIDILVSKLVLGQTNICFLRDGSAFLLPKVIDGNFELVGVKKDGITFPVELGINEIQFGNETLFTLVVRDITQHKEVARLKDEFISVVNHELRTPLTSIHGALGLILNDVVGETCQSVKRMVEVAHNNSIRLINLVNDILDIEKIESGKMEFKMEPVELMPLIEQTIEANEPYAQQYNVKLELKDKLPSIKIFADREKVIQVITNLLSNSIKFSHANSTVEISVLKNNNLIRVLVKDYGPGIPAEFTEKIFQKFAQADSSDSREKGGTGLGLSICKSIIDNLGGYIGFETSPNTGTTFYFDLPEWIEQKVVSKKRILICEDDKDLTFLLSLIFKQSDFDIDIAYNIELAKYLLSQNKYDIIVLDLILSGQDGVALLNKLQQDETKKNIPIIAISAANNGKNKDLKGSVIFADWTSKPIDSEKLGLAVKIATSNKLLTNKLNVLCICNSDSSTVVSTILGDIADIKNVNNTKDARLILETDNIDLIMLSQEISDISNSDLFQLLTIKNEKNIPMIMFANNGTEENSASINTKEESSSDKVSYENLINMINSVTKFDYMNIN